MDEMLNRPPYVFSKRPPAILPCSPRPAKEPPAGPGWITRSSTTGSASLPGATPRASGSSPVTATISRRASRRSSTRSRACRRSCVLDGEAIVVDERGLSVFDALRYRLRDHAAVLCAFDLIELDGEDLRWARLEDRKDTLATFSATPATVSPSTSISTATARSSSGTLALSGAKGSCRSAWVRPIARAASTIGSRSRTRRRPPCGAKRRRIGTASA